MPPTASIILIAVVAVLFVICVIADRNNMDKFVDKFETEHPYLDSLSGMHISKNGELIWEVHTGHVIGYKVWQLKDVGYVLIRTGEEKNTQYYAFRILGRDRKILHGKYYTASRRPVLQHAKRSFDMPDEKSLSELAEFVIRYGDDVKRLDETELSEKKN